LVPYLCIGGILLSGYSRLDKRKVSFLNLYGPCHYCKVLWEALEDVGLLKLNDLILAGDLNLITSSDELWGLTSQMDSLAGFFKTLFSEKRSRGCSTDEKSVDLEKWQIR
jgi:hypothetical protein